MKYFRRLMLAANLALLGLILLSEEIIQAAPLSGQGGASSTSTNDSFLWIGGILVAVLLISSLALLVLRRRSSK